VTKLLFRGSTPAEDNAIRGWLKSQGVKVDARARGVEKEALEAAGIDVARLTRAAEAAGIRDGFDLGSLRSTTFRPSPANLDEEGRALAELTRKNLFDSAAGGMERIGKLLERVERGDIPSRADWAQLAGQLGSVNTQLFNLAYGEEALRMAHWDLGTFAEVREVIQRFLAAVAELTEAAGRYVEGHFGSEEATRLQKGVKECQSAIHVVARDLRDFVPRAETLEADLAKTREEALQFVRSMGHDEAWQDRHFELKIAPTPQREDELEAAIYTKGRVDLDWSGRGIDHLFRSREWHEHTGDLILADNNLFSPWGLPSRLHGSLDLSRNAFDDLRAFDMHPIRVDGNVDLSHNPNLRDLHLLHHIEVGGDLNLVGIPATSLGIDLEEERPKVGGQIILHPSQVSLIADCELNGLAFRTVEDPSFKAFEKPADPYAWLRSVTWDKFPTEHDMLSVLCEIDFEGPKREALAKALCERALDPDPNIARAALVLLGRIDREARRKLVAPFLDLVPADHHAPLPAAIQRLSAPLFGALLSECHRVERFPDHDEHVKKSKAPGVPPYPDPIWHHPTPKTEQLALELVKRSLAGEPVSFGPLSGHLERQRDRNRDGDSILGDCAVALLASQLSEVEMEKREIRLVLRDGRKLQLEAALGAVEPSSSTFSAFERVLLRQPTHEALIALYERLPHVGNVGSYGGEERTARFLEILDALRAPSPSLAELSGEIGRLSRAENRGELEARLARIAKRAPRLSQIEREVVLHELLSTDLHELRHHADRQVRLAITAALGTVLESIEHLRRGSLSIEVMQRFMECFLNAPAGAVEAGLDRMFLSLLHALPSGQARGWWIALLGPKLEKSELGGSILTRFLEETIATASSANAGAAAQHEAFKTLHRIGNSIGRVISQERSMAVAQALVQLPLEGDLAFDRDEAVKVLNR
jgi:hypothetical protein